MPRRSPARGSGRTDRKKAPASTTAERRQQLRQEAFRRAAAEMQEAIAEALREEQAAWLKATGRKMPMNAEECVIEARVAGMSDEDLENPSDLTRGYEGICRAATVRKILRDEKVADVITVQVAVAERLASVSEPAVSEETRIANALSTNTRKVLAALDEWGANTLGNNMTRDGIEERTRLSECEVRNVMNRELPRQVVALVATKTGPGGGVWLTPEGAAVASTIDKKILPREVNSTAGKKH